MLLTLSSMAELEKRHNVDRSKYPNRIGQPWEDDEIVKLLTSVQKKKSIEQIAAEHERTIGGILSRLQGLAADYHFNDNRPTEEIQKFTGFTKEQVEEAILKRANRGIRTSHIAKTKPVKEAPPTMTEVVSLLKDIQTKLNILLQKVD